MPNFRTIISLLLVVNSIIFLLTACTPSTSVNPISSKSPRFRQGHEFRLIQPPQTVEQTDNRIEVVEMFFYACPHCYSLEPKLAAWRKENKNLINFKRIPAILGPSWAEQARAYYIAEKLAILDSIHPALLKAIHKNKRQFYNKHSLMKFFKEQGIAEQIFNKTYHSPEIAEKLNYARIMTVKYKLHGVPAVIINGKYKTAPFYVKSQEKMLQVIDYLITRERTLPAFQR